MKQRIISAFFGVIVLVLVLLGNQTVFNIVVTLISVAAIYEVIGATGLKEYKSLTFVAMLLPAALTANLYLSYADNGAIVFFFLSVMLVLMLFNHEKYLFSKVSVFLTVSAMISLSFNYVSMVRTLGNQNLDVLVVLIGCWITDTCAYFTGLLCGKHKLAPKISPKKTIEGSVGGILGVTIFLTAYAHIAANIIDNVTVNTAAAIATGLVCGIFSQLGDLVASVIKRENGVKDYGNIMPGHGGVMDRFDSFLFVAPIAYYMLSYFPIFVK